ncbi:MAG: hypothetical protein KTR30_10380 [Saprospiraceae bacterium]|nr:hypothetical protein [Saprospiraceae bacterium]
MRFILLAALLACTFPFYAAAQKNAVEIGVGIGNLVEGEHRLGKAEVHFSLFRAFQFGELGLDFASGGNFIPGESGITEDNSDILSSKDSRFSSIALLYRIPFQKHLFVEPRLGYSSLSAFIHTDDRRKLRQPNFSAGLGLGASLGNLSLSLRYQYLGKTADFTGFRGSTEVISVSEPVSLLLFRTSYRFNL